MKNRELMIEQINGIISFLPETDKNKLPESFVNFFKENAKNKPGQVINPNKKLEDQELCDESLLMLFCMNKIFKRNTNS